MKSWIAKLEKQAGPPSDRARSDDRDGGLIRDLRFREGDAGQGGDARPAHHTPLDDNSVGALLSLDQAMETLAARVTPAIVNVTVTSRSKAQHGRGGAEHGDTAAILRPLRPVLRTADAAAAAAAH